MSQKKATVGRWDTRDLADATTTEQAIAEGRCTCEGCPACRGVPGYPCSCLLNNRANERCPWCSITARRRN